MKKTAKILMLFCLLFAKINYKCNGQIQDRIDPNKIQLKVFYPESLPGDSLMLDVTSESGQVLIDHSRSNWAHYKSARDKNGYYYFKFNGTKSISAGNNYACVFLSKLKSHEQRINLNEIQQYSEYDAEMLPNYSFKNGDIITVKVRELGKVDVLRGYRHNFEYQFLGNNALFQNLWYKVDSIAYHVTSGSFVNENGQYNKSNYENLLARNLENWLGNYKNQLDPSDYSKLLSHAIFSALSDEALLMKSFLKPQFLKSDSLSRNLFISAYDSSFHAFENRIPQVILENSPEYFKAVFNKISLNAALLCPQSYEECLYTEIKNEASGNLRDLLIMYYFAKFRYEVANFKQQVDDALNIVKDPAYRNILRELQRVASGNIAYNFNLSDVNGRRVRLSDYKGKVVFMDFWYTGCGNCIDYFKNDLSKTEKHFESDPDVVFITVSIDKVKPFWTKSIQSGNYTSLHAVNLFTDGKGDQSDVIKYYHIISFPQPILIGKDQQIKVQDGTLRNSKTLEAAILKEEKD